MDIITIHCIISGHVQGVGFRKWIARQATLHHITGWVKNREDGSVEAVIQGAPSIIHPFVKQVHQGPPLASVMDLATNDLENTAVYDDFCVIQ